MRIKAAVIATLAISAGAIHAQISETIEVRITNIDAVVTDRAGNRVHGLTSDDFEILEDGKLQEITNFSEIREGVAAQGETRVTKESLLRRIVIFIDNASIHPHARTQALQAFEQSLDRIMRDGDEATVVMWNRKNEVVAPLTSDRAAIVKAMHAAAKRSSGSFSIEAQKQTILENAERLMNGVSTKGPRPSLSPVDAYMRGREAARVFGEQLWRAELALISDLRRTIDSLAGIPGKKVLLYLGSELSEDPGREIVQRVDDMWKSRLGGIQPAIAQPNHSLDSELRGLAAHANAQGVTMYMVDTSKTTRGASNDASVGSLTHAAAEPLSDGGTLRAMSNVAATTGGVAVPGGKTINTALSTIVNDLSSYYSLGFRAAGAAGTSRNVKVRVKNPAYRVRSRSTWLDKTAADVARERLIANLSHEVASDFDVTIAASAPVKQRDGRSLVQLSVRFPTTITLVPDGDHLAGKFGVLVVTGKPDGRMSRVSSDAKPMRFPMTALTQLEQQKTFTYNLPLLVESGEVIVSVGITDQVAGSAGFAKTKIVVP